MTRMIGFSTGSLAPGDVRRAVEMLSAHRTSAIELSALRTSELNDVLSIITLHDWSVFRYISFHAPSRFNGVTEAKVIEQIQPIVERRWPIIVHPDALTEWEAWAKLGSQVCIENMDGRKPGGRTVEELELIFARLPEARFCFDIGHARQIDPTMSLAHDLVSSFGNRLVEVHLSVVDDEFTHQQLTEEHMRLFGPVLRGLPGSTAIILETPVDEFSLWEQLRLASL